MKYLFYLFLILTIFSCSKDESDNCSPNPKLTTNEVSEITETSAKLTGKVIAPTCDPTVTSQGFVYSKTTLPKTDDIVIEVNGENLTSVLNNLERNTEYYVRTFFTNPIGEFYGNEVTFRTKIGETILELKSILDIKSTSAKCRYSITDNGGSEFTSSGVCWSTNSNPTINDFKTDDGTGLKSGQISNLTDLAKNTIYYVRVYATNEGGTTYSDEIAFTTKDGIVKLTTTEITSIKMNSAMSGYTVLDDGGTDIEYVGLCWGTNPTPTIENSNSNKIHYNIDFNSFSYSIDNLSENETYYAKAYATTKENETFYGDEKSFTTRDGIIELTTNTIENIAINSATSGGTIINDGGSVITSKGVCWNQTGSPTINDFITNDGSGIDSYTSILNGLNENTDYFIRAYARNELGTYYGNEISFKTKENTNSVYLDSNGVTVKAWDWAQIGELGIINGITYTIVDEQSLRNMIAQGNDVTKVCTSRVYNMQELFKDKHNFDQDISSWDTSNVTDMSSMFWMAINFNQNISIWDVSNVTNMNSMFVGVDRFNQPLGNWDVSNVTDMRQMFNGSYMFNQDIGNWDVGNVTNMEYMFAHTSSFKKDLSSWDVSNVTNMGSMFKNANLFNQDLGNWSVSNVTSCSEFSLNANSWTLPKPNFTNCNPN